MTTAVSVGAAAVPVFLSISGGAFLVALIVQNTKMFTVGRLISASSPNQNQAVRLYVFLVSLIVVFGDRILVLGVIPGRLDILDGLSATVAVTGAAILGYNLLTGDQQPTPPTQPLFPPPTK